MNNPRVFTMPASGLPKPMTTTQKIQNNFLYAAQSLLSHIQTHWLRTSTVSGGGLFAISFVALLCGIYLPSVGRWLGLPNISGGGLLLFALAGVTAWGLVLFAGVFAKDQAPLEAATPTPRKPQADDQGGPIAEDVRQAV